MDEYNLLAAESIISHRTEPPKMNNGEKKRHKKIQSLVYNRKVKGENYIEKTETLFQALQTKFRRLLSLKYIS